MHLHGNVKVNADALKAEVLMSDDGPSDAVVLAWARLVKAQARVLGKVEADLKAAGFPPLAWYDVLLELWRADGGRLRPLMIEDQLLLTQSNVSRLIDRLEKAGLVQRLPHPVDGRGQDVAITDVGRDLLKAMWPVYRSAIQGHVGRKLAGDDEAMRLAEMLGRLMADG
jgi:DNA-binding MarR family transcriptional regulator